MKALVLVGSGDVKSRSLGLAQAIEKQLRAKGSETELLNLIESGLPLYDRSVERALAYDDLTKTFLDKSYATDAFVWVTPIYHNSFSSTLKNALDWQHTKFPGKVVGMASNGGDRTTQAVDQLMLVARAQHLHSSLIRVCTAETDYDDDKTLTNQAMLDRVVGFCDALIHLHHKIKV